MVLIADGDSDEYIVAVSESQVLVEGKTYAE